MKYCVIHNISPHSQSDNKTYPSLADVQNTVKDIKNENVPHFNLHTRVPLFPDDEYVMWFWGKKPELVMFFFSLSACIVCQDLSHKGVSTDIWWKPSKKWLMSTSQGLIPIQVTDVNLKYVR